MMLMLIDVITAELDFPLDCGGAQRYSRLTFDFGAASATRLPASTGWANTALGCRGLLGDFIE